MGRKLRAGALVRDYPIELGSELGPCRPEAGEEFVIGQEQPPTLPPFHAAYRGTIHPTHPTELLLADQASLSKGMEGASGLLACE